MDETKRYFETAYKFVCKYKNLGEQYILSAKVHMDEETPHMHLIFLPVVHTIDKKGNAIDKLACSEFWKEKDSYRQLQNAFHKYMVDHNFQLERGVAVEETGRKHINLKEYKDITNFEKTKEKLQNIKLELPDVPNLEDINVMRFSKKRDEKIIEEITPIRCKELYVINSELMTHHYREKRSILDVRVKTQEGEYINIEVQSAGLFESLHRRFQYYAFKNIALQIKSGDEYRKLQPVYQIILYHEEDKEYHELIRKFSIMDNKYHDDKGNPTNGATTRTSFTFRN